MIVDANTGIAFDCEVETIDDLLEVLEQIKAAHPGCKVGTYEHSALSMYYAGDDEGLSFS